MSKATREYIEENNKVLQYIRDHVDVTNDMEDKIACDVFTANLNSEMNLKWSAVKVGKEMGKLGMRTARSRQSRYYCGIKFKNMLEDHDDVM